jgi:hypothetical protein
MNYSGMAEAGIQIVRMRAEARMSGEALLVCGGMKVRVYYRAGDFLWTLAGKHSDEATAQKVICRFLQEDVRHQ